ncbi:MarR family winged helix-turn-helix transcriptional regulator [Streptomyces lydicus]|uniref:MarR family winged helix-turn-helix transcriptional regulator n=1 Tax=Streptomyces lydicus TaxID=47763 RepID=UPI003790F5EF
MPWGASRRSAPGRRPCRSRCGRGRAAPGCPSPGGAGRRSRSGRGRCPGPSSGRWISLTHARALRVLADTGPLPIGQLAAATETTGAATTQLVNGLAAAGYVTRERPVDDKRSVLVTLTDTGRRRHHERQTALAQALDTALAHYETTALDTATDVLRQLAAIYDQL